MAYFLEEAGFCCGLTICVPGFAAGFAEELLPEAGLLFSLVLGGAAGAELSVGFCVSCF